MAEVLKKGNIRKIPTLPGGESWKIWNGKNWVDFNRYIPSENLSGGWTIQQQQEHLKIIAAGLAVTDIENIIGSNVLDYRFEILDPYGSVLSEASGAMFDPIEDDLAGGGGSEEYVDYEEGYPRRSMNLDQFNQYAHRNFSSGIMPITEYSGNLTDYFYLIPDLEIDDLYRDEPVVGPDPKGTGVNVVLLDDDGKPRIEKVLDSGALNALINVIVEHHKLLEDQSVSFLGPDGENILLFRGKAYVGSKPEELPDGPSLAKPITDEDGNILLHEYVGTDGKSYYIKPESPMLRHMVDIFDTKGYGDNIDPQVRENIPRYDQEVQQRGDQPQFRSGGLPVTPWGTPSVATDKEGINVLIRNIVPGYNAMETSLGKWELFPIPGFTPETRAGQVLNNIVPGYDAIATADGRLELVEQVEERSQMDMFRPFGLGDGRFMIRTGPNDHEIITPAGSNWFLDNWGNAYMKDNAGNLQPVDPPTIDEQINRALVAGDGGKALALSDFRDRPSAEERFRLAMEFARSPGDLMTISSILRGELEPDLPPPGQPGRRVAAPSPWVLDAWNSLNSAWGIDPKLIAPAPGTDPGDIEKSELQRALAAGDWGYLADIQGLSQEKQQRDIFNQRSTGVKLEQEVTPTTNQLFNIPRDQQRDDDPYTAWEEEQARNEQARNNEAAMKALLGSDINTGAGDPGASPFEQAMTTEPINNIEVDNIETQEERDEREAREIQEQLTLASQSGPSDPRVFPIARFIRSGNKYIPYTNDPTKPNASYRPDLFRADGTFKGDPSSVPTATPVPTETPETPETPATPATPMTPATPETPVTPSPAHLVTTDANIPASSQGQLPYEVELETIENQALELSRALDARSAEQARKQELSMALDARGPGRYETPKYPEFDPMGLAGGGKVSRDTTALVGEEGPELVFLPDGAEVIPADFTEAMLQGRRPLRMQYGGMVNVGKTGAIIQESDLETLRSGATLDKSISEMLGTDVSQFDLDSRGQYVERRAPDPPPRDWWRTESQKYPAGVRQVLSDRPIEQPRSLFRPAGLRVPSAQAMRNLAPEEMEAYRELGTLAGIPKGAYDREFREAMPGGQTRVRNPRFQARRQRRL